MLIAQHFRAELERTGLLDMIGGGEAMDTGLQQLTAKLLQVAGDMAVAEQLKVSLATAVFDTVNYPHLAFVHTLLNDAFAMAPPKELRPWFEQLAASEPPQGVEDVRRWVVLVAIAGENIGHRLLARLAVFEVLCVNQRLLLRSSGDHLEAFGGRVDDLEKLAEIEVLQLLDRPDYALALGELGDPLPAMVNATYLSLIRRSRGLREALLPMSEETAQELRIRGNLLQKLDGLEQVDAVLLRNHHAGVLGEEQVTVEQLQVRRPGLLGHLKRNTLDQRLSRLLKRSDGGLEPKRTKQPSIMDMLLSATPEVLS